MVVTVGDVKFRLSTQSGSAGNTVAGTPATSIGKYISTTDLTDAALQNLFSNVSAADSETGKVYYKCIFIANLSASNWDLVKTWFMSQVAGGGDVSVGVDPLGPKALGSAPAQAQAPANQNTAPAGVSFSNPATEAGALAVGTIPPNNVIGLWFRLTIPMNTTALELHKAIFRVQGQSDP